MSITQLYSVDSDYDCFYVHPTTKIYDDVDSNVKLKLQFIMSQTYFIKDLMNVYVCHYDAASLTEIDTDYNLYLNRAYDSFKSIFDDYMKNYNNNRNILLLGHSQGAYMIHRLLQENNVPNIKICIIPGMIIPSDNINIINSEGLCDIKSSGNKVYLYTWMTYHDEHEFKDSDYEDIYFDMNSSIWLKKRIYDSYQINPITFNIDIKSITKVITFNIFGSNIERDVNFITTIKDNKMLISYKIANVDVYNGGDYHFTDINIFMSSLRDNVKKLIS